MALGFKTTRLSLDRNHIKLLFIVGPSAYITYSLFMLGQYIPILNIVTSFMVMTFSVMMIAFQVSCAALNIRFIQQYINILNDEGNLVLRRQLRSKVKLIM